MRMKVFAAALLAVSALYTGIPLPEHPRPDWERAEWQNLNGSWDFGFAPDKYDLTITVPFGWGSPLSGVGNRRDVGYYRRQVTIPESWRGRRVFVVVGAADRVTEGRFAGQMLGTHVGGYTPFEFELTDLVDWGRPQPLEFKIADPSGGSGENGSFLYGKQGYGNVRGIWQDGLPGGARLGLS